MSRGEIKCEHRRLVRLALLMNTSLRHGPMATSGNVGSRELVDTLSTRIQFLVSQWGAIANAVGLSSREQDYLAPAFATAES